MPTSAQARTLFKSWNGLKEGPEVDKKIINPWSKKTGRKGVKSKTTPWCAIATASCLIQIGVTKLSTSAGCKQQMSWYKGKGKFKKRGVKPQVGWLVFYDFKGKGTPTHMGLVTSVNYKRSGYCYVIEGNKKLKDGKDGVGYRHISYTSKNILGFGVPYYK